MTIYTQGSFDLFHAGHVRFLTQCARFGAVTVALLTDQAYRLYRGYDPIIPFDQRKTVLEALRCVDQVIESVPARTKGELLQFKPDLVVVGSDWAGKDLYKQYELTQDWLDQHGFQLIYLPYTEGISSTQIKQRLCTT